MYRISEAARNLGISEGWLRKLEKQGKIPPVTRDASGHRRFTEKDLEQIRASIFHVPTEAA